MSYILVIAISDLLESELPSINRNLPIVLHNNLKYDGTTIGDHADVKWEEMRHCK
jgi:hypothetical protein